MSLYDDLKNSEPYINKKNGQQIQAAFCFKSELDLFKGHFPGNPILPGIFQIEMVKYSLEKSFNICLCIHSVKKTKFSNLIHPGETVYLDIMIAVKEISQFKVKATLQVGDSIAGKINLELTKK